jgi:hypothetical protein
MSFGAQPTQSGPSRQQRQSEMEAISIQRERDEEERLRREAEEANVKAERERLLVEQQETAKATQLAAETSAIATQVTSKPTEIEETIKITTDPITGVQKTTLEEKVPAGIAPSIGPVSPEGGAAQVPMGQGTLTPTVGAPGSIPTLQDTLGAANAAGATVTPGTTPATTGVEGQAVAPEKSFKDQALDVLSNFGPGPADEKDPANLINKPLVAKLGGTGGSGTGGAALRPGQMPQSVTPVTPTVEPMQGAGQPVVTAPVVPQPAVSGQQMMPQGGGAISNAEAGMVGPAIPQADGVQPVSYQVPGDDAYAMAQQQNYPMDELGNYYAPNGQVISPGMTMTDLTSVSEQTPVSPGGFAPSTNWDARDPNRGMFVPDPKNYPLVGGQQFNSPAAAYMAETRAEREQIGDGIDSAEVELSKITAVDNELPQVELSQAELDKLKVKNIADGGTEVGAIVEVDDAKDTIDAQVVKETDNALVTNNVDGLATLLVSDKVSPEKKDIIKENIKTITVNSVKEKRAQTSVEKTIASAVAGDKKAIKTITDSLLGKPPGKKPKDEGSWFNAILYGYLGQKDMQKQELKLLKSGNYPLVPLTDENGKHAGRGRIAPDGSIVPGSAIDLNSKVITENQLNRLHWLKADVKRSPYAVTKASMVYMPGTGKAGDADYIEAAGYQIETGVGKTPKIYDSTGKQVTDPTLAKNIMAKYAETGAGTTKAKAKASAALLEGSDGEFYRSVEIDDGKGGLTLQTRNITNGKPLPEGATILGRVVDSSATARINLNLINKLKLKHGENAIMALDEFRKSQPTTLTDKQVNDFISSYGTLDTSMFTGNGSTGKSTGPVAPQNINKKDISSSEPEGGTAPLQTGNLKIKKEATPSETITAPGKTAGVTTSPGLLALSTAGKSGYDLEGYAVQLPGEDIKKFADRSKAVQAEKARIDKNRGVLDNAIYGDIAELKINQSSSEEEADNKIRLVGELLTSPAFNSMVGTLGEKSYEDDVKGLIIGDDEGLLKVPYIMQGTPMASWVGIYNQVKGKAFMEAFKGLKGGGQISNIEGAKASGAITRISNKASRKAFKEGVDDFVYSIKRTINLNRRSMGQEPKYKNLVNPSIARNKTKEAVESANKPDSGWSIKPKVTN